MFDTLNSFEAFRLLLIGVMITNQLPLKVLHRQFLPHLIYLFKYGPARHLFVLFSFLSLNQCQT